MYNAPVAFQFHAGSEFMPWSAMEDFVAWNAGHLWAVKRSHLWASNGWNTCWIYIYIEDMYIVYHTSYIYIYMYMHEYVQNHIYIDTYIYIFQIYFILIIYVYIWTCTYHIYLRMERFGAGPGRCEWVVRVVRCRSPRKMSHRNRWFSYEKWWFYGGLMLVLWDLMGFNVGFMGFYGGLMLVLWDLMGFLWWLNGI